ncbi:MAG: hypothetical protein HUK08_06595 [Bacteroidaceae bacterium]|nr:hypothetical protein [Bacteroidaceae bacterium]
MQNTRILIISLLFIAAYTTAIAQPSAVKNVQKAVLSFVTYDSEGKELASGNGVFISTDGEAVATCKPFIGAYKAVVTDHSGKQMEVSRICGANEVHNVIHFKVDAKTPAATLLNTTTPQQGAKVYCVGPESIGKTSNGAIKKTETFMDKYAYYIMKIDEQADLEGCPIINEQGQVLGLLQTSNSTADAYATDVRYAQSLMPQALSATNTALLQIHIPMQLPSDQQNAQIIMMMLSSSKGGKYEAAANDFMKAFPDAVDGYSISATIAAANKDFNKADNIMQQALKRTSDKALANYEYSKLVYNISLALQENSYAPWTFDKAMELIKNAERLSPASIYKNHEANILFSQKKYIEAYSTFQSLLENKDINKAEIYYSSARCKQALQAPKEEILALLDSAISHVDTLSVTSSAPYFLMRGQYYDEMQKYKEAVIDYTRYLIIMQYKVNDNFYYLRFLAANKCRMYPQALSDITSCIAINPKEPLYPAEKAQLELKLGKFKEAEASANYCIQINPEGYTGYTLLALIQAKSGNKTEAHKTMQKAKELGEPNADTYTEKYLK